MISADPAALKPQDSQIFSETEPVCCNERNSLINVKLAIRTQTVNILKAWCPLHPGCEGAVDFLVSTVSECWWPALASVLMSWLDVSKNAPVDYKVACLKGASTIQP